MILNTVQVAVELIQIGSINPAGLEVKNNTFGEGAIAGRIKAILRSMGASEVETTYPLPGRPNVLGYFNLGASESLLFEAHMDTVPVAGMTIDPFGGELRDGRLWGRGACDVKGPMAAMLSAISQAKASGSANYNVLFAAVCDEESGFSGVRHMLKHLSPDYRKSIAFAVVAEPTELLPLAAHKGVVRWTITAHGKATHSSTPELGENAIYTMSQAISRLQVHAAELPSQDAHPQLGAASISVGVITGGSAVNVVPDSCTIQVDRRLIPGETADGALQQVCAALAGLPSVEISAPTVAAPAFQLTPDARSITACLAAAKSVRADSRVDYANYCTDASFYADHDIEAVVFGPGCIAQAHTADEWISVDALEQGTQAYLHLITG